MNNLETLSGTIERLLFKSPDSGYAVILLHINAQESVTVTGHFPTLQPGERASFEGRWQQHPKFGKQFVATSCTAQMPTTLVGLQKYLGSGLIKGIGPVYAKKIVAHFGTQTLQIIEEQTERLIEVEGIGQKRVEQIQKAWIDQKEIASIMIFLQEKGISATFATKIYKQYGKQSIAIVTENPYRLAEDIWGIGFKSADACAQKLGFEKHSLKRIKAGIIYALTQVTTNGHLYSEVDELKKSAKQLLEVGDEVDQTVKNALHELYNANSIKLLTHNEQHFITLSQYYNAEKGLATTLKTLVNYPSKFTIDIDTIYQTLRTQTASTVSLNEDQQRAILTCLQSKVTIITGGPGTGKTTLIKMLLNLLDEHKKIYKLAAPTGRAAKRITEGTGRYAATLHRLLEFDPGTMRFVHNEQNALKLDFLIIDEASMIDTFLAYALVKALPQTAHLVIIGDTDQLPSVGAGNVLANLIASGCMPSVQLTQIFRQAQDSLIVVNAHRINKGEFPVSSLENARKDFIFIKEENPEAIVAYLQEFYNKKRITRDKDFMVLTPMNRGSAGTAVLNYNLQTIMNQHTEQSIMHIGTTYKLYDKVMQIRNNYDKNVFNGDIGIIQVIDQEEKQLTVNFDERLIVYEFAELNELVLAYAISIHKSQGSEFDTVIIPLFMQHFMLLQRNLIYTALTRAKRMCIIIGQPKALAMAIKNNKTTIRKTFLKEFLTTDLAAR